MSNALSHHGILGMKWGIRRYQNYDGTLTPEGRERLGYNKYVNEHKDDIILKKGTKATRGVGGLEDYWEKSENKAGYEKQVKTIKEKEKNLNTKYVSIDDVRNSGRANGKEYYTSWFSDYGYEPDNMYMDTYTLKHDVRVASGQKVIDELLNQIGSQKITEALEKGLSIKSLTTEYTQDQNLFKNVNDALVKQGYEAIEDINDHETDMPVIFLNSKNNLLLKYTQTGEEVIKEILEKQKRG